MSCEASVRAAEMRDRLVDLTRALVRAETYNLPGNEEEAARGLSEFFESVGVDYLVLGRERDRPNLIAWVGEGEPCLLLAGHLDTVPPGGGWTYDPLSADLRDGRIYGRGATDMKGGVAAAAVALAALAESGVRGKVLLAATADEEMGSEYGMAWLARKRPDLIKADFALVCEPSGSEALGKFIVVGEKGSVVVRITAKGKLAHSSVPELGENAIEKMASLLARIRDAGVRKVRPPISRFDLLRQFASKYGWLHLLRNLLSTGENRRIASAVLRAMTSVTVSPGIIRGGVKVNVVPDHCEADVDFRILPGHTPEDVIEAVNELVRRLGLEGVEVEALEFVEPSVLTGPDWPVDLLESLVKRFYWEKPLRIVMPGASDARFLRNWLGVPAVQFGPGVAEAAHAADEYVEVDDLMRSAQVYAEFVSEFLARWPG